MGLATINLYTNRPWSGRGYVTWHVLNFGCPIHISGMAEARALKLCTKGDYVKSGHNDDKSQPKWAWFCSRDPFFVCTAVELERNLHCTRWFAINCVLDDGYWVSHLWWSTLVLHTLRLKLHIGLICHRVCCKVACITYRQQINQVEFEHYHSNMC